MRERLLKIIFAVAVFCVMLFIGLSKKSNLLKNTKAPVKTTQEQSPYKKYGHNIDEGLSKYKEALKNSGTQKVKIYCIGESNTRGEYSSDEVNKSWVGVMKTSLQNQYGNAGEGFISIYEGALPPGTKPRWAVGSGWKVYGAPNVINTNVGGFGGCYGSSSGNISSATLVFNGTDLDLLYSRTKDGGTATVAIDGKEVDTISCFGEESSFSHKTSYSGLSKTAHTLIITPNTKSNVYIEGAISSSNKTGVQVDKISISSKGAGYFNSPLQKNSWDTLSNPDLVILSFGLNEASNHISVEVYKANMIGLVTYWQERGSNVCIVPNQKPAESWTKNWTDYVAAMYEISNAYNTGIIDIYEAFFKDYTLAQQQGLFGMARNDYSGGSGTNTGHPSDKGYKYIGDVIYANLQ
ncbi:SGNH/GDSL hydrolase family protein [Clostridium thailandense]|uniref:SGNH/GDSL hydrolase family protein n=1 Tax=Clostridium thailandense TaxID=2794346 RepID=UPI0039899AF9